MVNDLSRAVLAALERSYFIYSFSITDNLHY
nr:MAG TPA: hypothetical protein [Caudoviricetes sp.]